MYNSFSLLPNNLLWKCKVQLIICEIFVNAINWICIISPSLFSTSYFPPSACLLSEFFCSHLLFCQRRCCPEHLHAVAFFCSCSHELSSISGHYTAFLPGNALKYRTLLAIMELFYASKLSFLFCYLFYCPFIQHFHFKTPLQQDK